MLLIDGHNLMGRTPGLSLQDEERSREALLRAIAAAQATRREPVVVVFDGDRPGGPKETRFGRLVVVYAPAGRPADGEILRRLSSGNPRASTVVTSDLALARLCRDQGARVVSCEEFLARRASRGGPSARQSDDKPEANPEDVDEWLRVFRGAGRGPVKHKI